MSPAPSVFQKPLSAPPHVAYGATAVLVGLVVVALEILRRVIFPIPNPGVALLLPTIYATARYGYGPGVLAAVCVVLYTAVTFSIPGKPFQYLAPDALRVVVVSAVGLTAVLLVGRLRLEAAQAAELRTREAVLATQAEEQAREAARLRRYVTRLENLHEIDEQILAGAPAQETFRRALDGIRRLVDSPRVGIVLFHWEQDEWELYAVSADEVDEEIPVGFRAPLDGLTGEALTHDNGIQLVDAPVILFGGEEGRAWLRRHGFRARLTVPLRTDDEVLGAILVPVLDPEVLDQSTTEVVTEAARQLTIVLQTERFRDQQRADAEARRQSEERFRLIVEAAQEGIVMADPAGRVTFANPYLEAMLGVDPGELLGRPVFDFFCEGDRAAAMARLARRQQGETGPVQVEYRLRRADNRTLWALGSDAAIRDADGRLTAVLGIMTDITSRKQAEAERERLLAGEHAARLKAEEAQHRLQTTLESISDGFLLLDENWRVTYLNSHAEELCRVCRDEMLGRVVRDLIPEARQDGFMAELERARTGGHRVVFEEFSPSLQSWFEVRAYPAGSGLAVYLHDISPQRRAEEALAETQRRLALAVRAADVGLWDWNLETNQVYFSPEWKAQLGCADDEIANDLAEWQARLHPDDVDRMASHLAAYMRNPWPNYEAEFRLRHRDGAYRWILARASLVRDETGKPFRMLGSHIDITARKQMEESLRRSLRQLRELSQRLERAREAERASMAREIHDVLGQALTALKLDLVALRRQFPEGAAGLHEHSRSMSALLDETLSTVRRMSAELRPRILDDLGLAAALEWLGGEFQKRTRLGFDLAAPSAEVRLDPDRAIALFRIVQEALTNVVRHAEASHVSVRLVQTPEETIVEVVDDGRGIRSEDLADAGRLGVLGMRERAELFGGEVSVTPRPSGGTRVRVSLPAPAGPREFFRSPDPSNPGQEA